MDAARPRDVRGRGPEHRDRGLHGAFDVTVRDTLPSGFVVPSGGLDLSVTDGGGTALAYVGHERGARACSTRGSRSPTRAPLSRRRWPHTDPTSGKNLLIVTYDLQVASTASANAVDRQHGQPDRLRLPARRAGLPRRLARHGHRDGERRPSGHRQGDHRDESAVHFGQQPRDRRGRHLHRHDDRAGRASPRTPTLVDTLPSGLAYVGPAIDLGLGGPRLRRPVRSRRSRRRSASNGSTVTFNLGTITDTDTNNAQAETITIVYQRRGAERRRAISRA